MRKTQKVTKLEHKVLHSLASQMYAEPGFSDVGIEEMVENTKLPSRVLRGVASSLIKKGLLWIDDRREEGYKNQVNFHIWYLDRSLYHIVEAWRKYETPSDEVQVKLQIQKS